MRSHRMRGYGAWCMGWRDGGRRSGPPSGNGWGCGVLVLLFAALLVFTSVRVALETGSGLALLLGFAVIMGIVKGMTER